MKKLTTLRIGLGASAAILLACGVPAASAATSIAVPCAGQNGGPAGLIAAIHEANSVGGATVNLAPRCSYELLAPDNGSNGGTGLPVITSQVTLNGADTTIAGNNSDFRILEVDGPGGRLTLRGMIITGGSSLNAGVGAAGAGGGILNDEGTLVLDASQVTGNAAEIGGGGIASGTLGSGPLGTTVLNDSQVTDNTVSAGEGGGILNDAGTLTMNDSLVSGNTAPVGGGIASDPGSGTIAAADLTINGSQITGNTADVEFESPAGGGVANGGTATIMASRITGNTAPGGQGGGMLNYGTLTVKGSVVSRNTAPDDGAQPGQGFGGGIANLDFGFPGSGVLIMNHGSMTGNTSSEAGGAIFSVGSPGAPGSVSINHLLVARNTATQGGAIANESVLAVNFSLLTRNTATEEGGGIYNDGGTVTLTHAVVAGNQIDNCFPAGSISGCQG